MPILHAVVRRGATAARPSVARSLNVSATVAKDSKQSPYFAGVPIPRSDDGVHRDLTREQVNRESEPTPVSIASDAPSTLLY